MLHASGFTHLGNRRTPGVWEFQEDDARGPRETRSTLQDYLAELGEFGSFRMKMRPGARLVRWDLSTGYAQLSVV